MELRSLTYTSTASSGLDRAGLGQILHSARALNGLDGVTGLLVFNGRTFLQVIEGADDAIDDLMARLGRDPRHHDMRVQDDRRVMARSFPDWSMLLAETGSNAGQAGEAVSAILPEQVSPPVRDMIQRMVDNISV